MSAPDYRSEIPTLLRRVGYPIGPTEIARRLGDSASLSYVNKILPSLVEEGAVTQLGRGKYSSPRDNPGVLTDQASGYGESAVEYAADDTDIYRVPMLAVEVVAGESFDITTEHVTGYIPFSVEYCYQRFGLHPRHVRVVTITGTSMLPTLKPGDLVAMAVVQPDEPPRDDHVFVLFGPIPWGGTLVKRLRFRPGGLNVVSDAEPEEPVWSGTFNEFRKTYRLVARQLEIVGSAF